MEWSKEVITPLLPRAEMIMFLHICQSAGLTEWQTFGT